MGVDGSNCLAIRGPQAILDTLESTGLAIDNHDLSERFFGPNKVEVLHRDSRYLVVSYEFRNKPVYHYLEALLNKYPTCWFKNTYSTETGECGMWIGRIRNGEKEIQEFEWEELTIEEICCIQE